MKRFILLVLGTALAHVCATAYATELTVTYVGDNPFPDFVSTGGTGTIESQTAGQSAVLTKTFTALGDVPIILHSNPSSGTDTIHIDERVTNDTGVDWTDFHLIFGEIDNSSLLSIEFLNVANPTGEFTTITSTTNLLSLFGDVPTGTTFSLSFDLQANSDPGAFDLFGIREVPSTVDEPAALALIGLSAILGFSLRRRRTRLL